jgi:hypothetical protein
MLDSIQPVDGMPVILVMPCLDEVENLRATCASLGFGTGPDLSPPGTQLIIVDNGSSDSTLDIAEQVKRESKANAVLLEQEQERGFVPPRNHGNLTARAVAHSSGWDPEQVLILQVDADLHYATGYVAEMRAAMKICGPNVMIEACLSYPQAFQDEYPVYMNICNSTDAEFTKLFPSDFSHDGLVVDAVSGYRLSDYFRWGGHHREFNAHGDEIHAETTRLFMRSRVQRATRHLVEAGQAFHSPRKVLKEPALHLATAGFPREASWNRAWQKLYQGPGSLRDLCAQPTHPEVQKAIRIREEHLLALLALLPMHVDRTLRDTASNVFGTEELVATILPLLPIRNIDDLESRPATLISDVLELIATHGEQLLKQARQIVSRNYS